MKKILLLISVVCIHFAYSQGVGIKTPNPIGAFHVDSNGNNPVGTPTLVNLIDDFLIDNNGNVNFRPQNNNTNNTKLFIFNSTGDNVRIEGLLTAGAPQTISVLGAFRPAATVSYLKREQSIDAMSIPRPTVFELTTDIPNFLNGVSSGGAQDIPMTMIKNAIDGLTYDEANHTVFLPEGMYQITVLYKANHPGCTISSYFYDFPFSTSFTRVHNNTRHLAGVGAQSVHAGKITYATQVPAGGKFIRINLGRGQSGNCSGLAGMNLLSDGTQFLINRIGD